MKAYQGLAIDDAERRVAVFDPVKQESGFLRLRLDLAIHSPTGFAWGYIGSGPSQLSLSLLADAFQDNARALRLYHRFSQACISKIPQDEGWALSDTMVRTLAKQVEREIAPGGAASHAGRPEGAPEDP